MILKVWKNKANNQKLVTIPQKSEIEAGNYIEVNKVIEVNKKRK